MSNSFNIRLCLGCLAITGLPFSFAFAQTTTRVSVDSLGNQGIGRSLDGMLSADGRCVAFYSYANLVQGDTNGVTDVFVRDRVTGLTTRASVSSLGVQGNSSSYRNALSGDGRYVAYYSYASNLVPSDMNGQPDIFVHDRSSRLTTRVSLDSHGGQANGGSLFPAISADGRLVTFESSATNLVPGDTNQRTDIFVHDRATGQTTRVSVDSVGVQGNGTCGFPAISADGRFVAFHSSSNNLVQGDTNGTSDTFIHDVLTGMTTRVSVDSAGGQANGNSINVASLSADGRYVAFESSASNLVAHDTNSSNDVFMHDRHTGRTTCVSVEPGGVPGNGNSVDCSTSADGRFVSFASSASNLAPGDTNGVYDVFVHDMLVGRTERVNIDTLGGQGNDRCYNQSISADGRFIAFDGDASNLVPGDTNGDFDVFVHDRGPLAGAVEGTIVLSADVQFEVGEVATFSWFAAPPYSRYFLLTSSQNRGTTIAGHLFGLGPGLTAVDYGWTSARGTGVHVTASFPTWTRGRTVYIEVASRDASGRIYDSNTLERTVQ